MLLINCIIISTYDCLQESLINWNEEDNNYILVVQYMLGAVVAAYRDFSGTIRKNEYVWE